MTKMTATDGKRRIDITIDGKCDDKQYVEISKKIRRHLKDGTKYVSSDVPVSWSLSVVEEGA